MPSCPAPTASGGSDDAITPCWWVALQTGLRVSELAGLTNGDVELRPGAHLRCRGKGRKQHSVPLRVATAAVLRSWMKERAGAAGDPLFPTYRGSHLSR